MRLFFLFYTSIADMKRLAVPPREDDIVLYVRHGQVQPMARESHHGQWQGTTIFLEDLMDREATSQANALGADFVDTWFKDGAVDFSSLGDVSLGLSYSPEIAKMLNPSLLIRKGEALRKILEDFPRISEIISDARNGRGFFQVRPDFFPLADVVRQVARHAGKAVRFVEPVEPFAVIEMHPRYSLKLILYRFLGGFRRPWLKAAGALARRRREVSSKPFLYMFIGRDQQALANKLVEGGRFHVVCNELSIPGTDARRCDHIFALPALNDIRIVRSLLRQVYQRGTRAQEGGRFVLGGIDYGGIFYTAVGKFLKAQVWAFLFVVAQSRKFQQITGAQALVINGAGNEPMGNLVQINRHTDMKIYLTPHGMNMTMQTYLHPSVDELHIHYLAFGADHANYYHYALEDQNQLKRTLVGNPLTVAMNAVRSEKPAIHGKRLLILSFGHYEFLSSRRAYAVDQYYIEIFGIIGNLLKQGWTVTIRPHPYHGHDLEDRLLAGYDFKNSVQWDSEPTFQSALPKYDVVVSNLTSAFYQSLYAGWPTIFYEPDYRKFGGIEGIETDPVLTGLLTAKDLDRPVTNDPAILAAMVRESLEPDSMVSTFPVRFAGELAPRFIGPDPEHADSVIAGFVENNFFDNDQPPSNHVSNA